MNRKLWLLMTWLLVVPAFVQAASVKKALSLTMKQTNLLRM